MTVITILVVTMTARRRGLVVTMTVRRRGLVDGGPERSRAVPSGPGPTGDSALTSGNVDVDSGKTSTSTLA